MTLIRQQLYVYPIKAIRGIELKQARLGPQGIEHDRRFMLYQVKPEGKLRKMQLSSFPQCALFEQELIQPQEGTEDGRVMIAVRYHPPNEESSSSEPAELDQSPATLLVPLEPDISSLEKARVDLHGSPTTAYHMGEPYDSWFSARFGFPTVLVFIGDGKRAVLGKSLLPQHSEEKKGWASSISTYLTGGKSEPAPPWLTFTDVAPVLVTSEASLEEVSTRLPEDQPMSMYKFRPNIVVDGHGEDAWAEDFWAELSLGATGNAKNKLLLTANCGRCTSLNVDYDTGKQAEGELGTVLKKLQKDRRVDTGTRYSPIFGRYAFPVSGNGNRNGNEDANGFVTVSVGDEVEVTRRNTERSVWDWPNL